MFYTTQISLIKAKFFSFVLMLLSLSCLAQKTGYIIEKGSKKGIENVAVFYAEGRGSLSRSGGKFTVPDTCRSLELHRLGYKDLSVNSFSDGDTLKMEKEVGELEEVEVADNGVDRREFLQAILDKSALRYQKNGKKWYPYSFSGKVTTTGDVEYSYYEYSPRVYYNIREDKSENAEEIHIPFLKKARPPFTWSCTLPGDSSTIRRTGDSIHGNISKVLSKGAGAFRRSVPLPRVPVFLASKGNTYFLSYSGQIGLFEIGYIMYKGLGREVKLHFDDRDSLLTEYEELSTHSTWWADQKAKLMMQTLYKEYKYSPPYHYHKRISYKEVSRDYIPDEIHLREEYHFEVKESGKLFILKRELRAKLLEEEKPMTREELRSLKMVNLPWDDEDH